MVQCCVMYNWLYNHPSEEFKRVIIDFGLTEISQAIKDAFDTIGGDKAIIDQYNANGIYNLIESAASNSISFYNSNEFNMLYLYLDDIYIVSVDGNTACKLHSKYTTEDHTDESMRSIKDFLNQIHGQVKEVYDGEDHIVYIIVVVDIGFRGAPIAMLTVDHNYDVHFIDTDIDDDDQDNEY